MEKIQAIFAVERIEYFIGWDDIVIPGLLIVFENTTENLREVIAGKDCFAEGQTKRITVLADYEASGDGARILNKVYCIVRDTQVRDREAGKALSVRFDESIEMLTERHLIAGRLQRSAVKFDPTEWIVYEDMTASIYSDLSRSSSLEVAPRYVGQVNVGLNFTGDKVPLGELRAFVEVLFERKVLRKAIGFPT